MAGSYRSHDWIEHLRSEENIMLPENSASLSVNVRHAYSLRAYLARAWTAVADEPFGIGASSSENTFLQITWESSSFAASGRIAVSYAATLCFLHCASALFNHDFCNCQPFIWRLNISWVYTECTQKDCVNQGWLQCISLWTHDLHVPSLSAAGLFANLSCRELTLI